MTLHYHGRARKLLKQNNIEDFDLIEIITSTQTLEGILIPRPELEDDNHVVIKLSNGYNLGVRLQKIKKIKVLKKQGIKRTVEKIKKYREEYIENAEVTVIGTGGTIASRVDYSTGAVYPQFTAKDLLLKYPEVKGIAKIRTKLLFNILSEDMDPHLWVKIAETVSQELNSGVKGVVVTHGTDTLHYTAAALSFMLETLSGPVVLTGAQRSSDRGSTDAYLNFLSSVRVASYHKLGEVVVVMHQTPSDNFCVIHRGTKVRKMHTSRRDAFLPVNSSILGLVNQEKLVFLTNYRQASQKETQADTRVETKVGLIQAHPGINPEIIDFYLDKNYRGLVIAGTGLGHVPKQLLQPIKRAIDEKTVVVLTSQCLYGRVNLRVYRRGRELLKLGVIPGEDMLPEVALVKLMIGLGRFQNIEEVKSYLLKNVAGEINSHLSLSYFPPTNK